MKRRFYKSVSKKLPQRSMKTIFQSKNRLNNLYKFKDPIPLYFPSHFIWKFQCSNYNITFNGKTELHLNVRADESTLTGKKVNNSKKSAVKHHSLPFVRSCVILWWFYCFELWIRQRINHYWKNKLITLLKSD